MTTPRLDDFRRIVVKVGSSLLVDSPAGRLKRVMARCRSRPTSPRCIATDAMYWWSRQAPSRWAAPCSSCRAGPLQARGQPGRRRGRPDRAGAHAGRRRCRAHGITAGQVLVTLGDTEERRRYLNARSTIDKLLEWRAVPVINENDTVATTEIRYGDNDRLAARVATMMSADLLVLLSDVDGLYDAPPGTTAGASYIAAGRARHRRRSRRWRAPPDSELSRGGMQHQDRGGKDRHRPPARTC